MVSPTTTATHENVLLTPVGTILHAKVEIASETNKKLNVEEEIKSDPDLEAGTH